MHEPADVRSGEEREPRQLQPGGPPFGELPHLPEVLLSDVDAEVAEQLAGLADREAQVLVPKLEQPPVEPKSADGERRIVTRRQHDAHGGRERADEGGHDGRLQPGVVEVVDDDHQVAGELTVAGEAGRHVDRLDAVLVDALRARRFRRRGRRAGSPTPARSKNASDRHRSARTTARQCCRGVA